MSEAPCCSLHELAGARLQVACSATATVLEAEGDAQGAATLRFVGRYVAQAPEELAPVCVCAVVPCTPHEWRHAGHCCRVTGDHQVLFAAAHQRICDRPQHARVTP